MTVVTALDAHGLFPVERARVIRASSHAHATADAFVIVDFDTAHVVFVRSSSWAHPLACRVFAVLASKRQIVSREIWIGPDGSVDNVAPFGQHSVP